MKFKNLILIVYTIVLANYTKPALAQTYADDVAQIIFDNYVCFLIPTNSLTNEKFRPTC